MSDLAQQQCTPCRKNSSPVDESICHEWLTQLVGWKRLPNLNCGEQNPSTVPKLSKQYRFSNFVEAISFANQVAELAEQYDHHPLLIVEWGSVTVQWWTHSIAGLHVNDFILAAKTDEFITS